MPVIQPIVEIAFEADPLSTAPVWSDVTRYVHIDTPIEMTRGRSDELADIQPGRCSLTLDNTDARFTPHNPGSPYYPYVKKGRHLRVRTVHVDTNYVTTPLYGGPWFVGDWDGWGSTTAPTASTDSTRVHYTGPGATGSSARFTWKAGNTGGQNLSLELYGLDIGSVYTATAWVWVPGGQAGVQLGVVGMNNYKSSAATDTWTQITVTFTATSTRHLLQLVPRGAVAADWDTWLDEVQVNAGPTAAPFSPTGAYLSPRFDGYVNQWPISWPGGGRVATTTITATDLTKRLSPLEMRSFLEEEVLADQPLAYYPMSEPSTSTSAGDVSGTPGGPLVTVQFGAGGSGSLAFGAGRGPGEDGLSCPQFAPQDGDNGKYLVADAGTDFESQSSAYFIGLECWFATTNATAGRVFMAMYSLDWIYSVVLSLDTTGKVLLQSYDSNGSNTATYNTPNLADDQVHHVVYSEVDGRIWIDGVDYGTGSRRLMHRLRMLDIGGHRNVRIWNGTVAHAAVYAGGTINTAWVQRHYQAGAAGFAGETADVRVQRIARYVGLDPATVGTVGTFSAVASQGPGRRSAVAMIQEVGASESALVFAGRTGGITLQSRSVRYSAPPAVTLSAVDLDGPPVYVDDDQKLANDVRASRPGGATITVTDPASQADYGRYTRTLSLLKATDVDTVDAASWHLARYSDPTPRLQSLPVDGYGLPTATYRALLDCDLSSLIALTDLPSQAPAATDQVHVEGYTEQLGRHAHRWTFTTSPATRDQVWTLDDPVQSALDAGYRLAY